MSFDRLSILLLQARDVGDPMLLQEREAFAEFCHLQLDQIVSYDLIAGPPELSRVRAHDAMMVGGSGDYYVSKGNLPGFQRLMELLRTIVACRHPVFASCFGFQCLVEALGGEIVHDTERVEVGTFAIELTAIGAADELLGQLPPSFQAQLGRKDRAARLPDGVLNLARSERCPYQALRVPGSPIWATQFHPELDKKSNKARFIRYLDGYAFHMSEAERDEALGRFQDSHEANRLLRRFISLVFA